MLRSKPGLEHSEDSVPADLARRAMHMRDRALLRWVLEGIGAR